MHAWMLHQICIISVNKKRKYKTLMLYSSVFCKFDPMPNPPPFSLGILEENTQKYVSSNVLGLHQATKHVPEISIGSTPFYLIKYAKIWPKTRSKNSNWFDTEYWLSIVKGLLRVFGILITILIEENSIFNLLTNNPSLAHVRNKSKSMKWPCVCPSIVTSSLPQALPWTVNPSQINTRVIALWLTIACGKKFQSIQLWMTVTLVQGR